MTTDTRVKEYAVEFELDGKTVYLGGIAKGSGMIHPNMGTMLCFLTSDAKIASPMLDKALHDVVKKTFNRISVDGDTSTNDMCIVLANGMAGNAEITEENEDYAIFKQALFDVMQKLAIAIAKDGEGASRLITVEVRTAKTEEQAETLARSVACSSLLKAAMFGKDANWGRSSAPWAIPKRSLIRLLSAFPSRRKTAKFWSAKTARALILTKTRRFTFLNPMRSSF